MQAMSASLLGLSDSVIVITNLVRIHNLINAASNANCNGATVIVIADIALPL